MFPISDSKHERGGFPVFNLALIVVNVIAFLIMYASPNLEVFVNTYALVPANINFSNIPSLLPFITSIFLHGGIFHLASNMWFLWIFGDNIEAELGPIKFLLLYLLSGIAGSFLQYILNPDSTIPMLGASGAVSGVMGAYLAMFPRHTIKSVIPIFLVFTVVNIPALFYIGYWFLIQIFSGFSTLPGDMQADQGGVAFFAHIGGFVVGFVLAKILQTKRHGFIEGKILE